MSTSPIPEVEIASTPKSFWSRVSVVWLVPLAALAIALGVAWHNYAQRGPLISITFENAAGVVAKRTELRFRDVAVGMVEKVQLAQDMERVTLGVRLDPSVAPFVDAGSEFWIVRPEVTAQGVSGIETVLSGVYLAGAWDQDIGAKKTEFKGNEKPRLLGLGQDGLSITLRSSDSTLSGNGPILYKGAEIGRIGPATVSADGAMVEAEAVIYGDYNGLITEATRFWNASGFSLSIGPSGAALNFDSLASLIAGGVTLETFVSGAPLVGNGASFEVFADATSARASLFAHTGAEVLNLTAVFEGDVTGLAVGAGVELEGLAIGEVSALNGYIDAAAGGALRLEAILSVQPSRLGLLGADARDEALNYFAREIESSNLRARLVTGSLITGGLKVQLFEDPDAVPATLDVAALPYPIVPTTKADVTDIGVTAQGALNRISNLPIEDLMGSAISFLNSATLLVGDARAVAGAPEMRALPGQIGQTVGHIEAAAEKVNLVMNDFTTAKGVERLFDAVGAVYQAAEDLTASLEGVPEFVQSGQSVLTKVEQLEIEAALTALTSALESAADLLADERMHQLPADLSTGLVSLAQTLDLLREGGLVENANAALQSARSAADGISGAAGQLPSLVDRVNALVSQAAGAVANFDETSNVMRDARSAIREVAAAASAVADLARAIERRPNSLLFGR